MEQRANKLRRLHELEHHMALPVVQQAEKAFRYILGDDPNLRFTLSINQGSVGNGHLDGDMLIQHCIDREVPLVVRTTAHESLKSKSFFFLNPSNREQVRIYSLDGSSDVYKVPVDTLRVDLDFEYMSVDSLTMK